MGLVLTYEQIKDYIDNAETGNGCKLNMTKEEFEEEKIKQNQYNTRVQLQIICKCNNIYFTSFHDFAYKKCKRKQCPKCGKINQIKKQTRKDYSFEIDQIKNYGYNTLNIEKYKSFTTFYIQDNIGYQYKINISGITRLINGQSMKFQQFGVGNPYTIINIKLWLLNNCPQYKLISEEFVKSDVKLRWLCPEGHYFDASWNNFLMGKRCPYCSGKLPSIDYNLLHDNPKLCEEWDYEKNEKSPQEYTPYSGKKVWWVCKECGYEWEAYISTRNGQKCGCPKCNVSKGEIQINQYLTKYQIDFTPQKGYEDLLGLGNRTLSYDFYLPNYNLLIEYQGEFHDGSVKPGIQSKEDLLRQQEHDRRKREYAKKNNINLLEIWYWDFDNIESILSKELKILN